MIYAVITLIFGFVLLIIGADRLVTGAAAIATNLGVGALVIGLTIVALGTSAPEIVVSIVAAIEGNSGLAIGNAIGSNIANIGLVLGFTAMFVPLKVHSKLLRREYPVFMLVTLAAGALLLNGHLTRIDGVLLLLGLGLLILWLLWLGLKKTDKDPLLNEFVRQIPHGLSNKWALLWLIVGICLLPIGSHLLVKSAVIIAKALGVSNFVIGLSIIAVGTSLPEIATTLAAAFKDESDIAIGNIIGSNMFNILAVLPFPALIDPGSFPPYLLQRDYLVMLGLSLVLFPMALGFGGRLGCIERWEGALLCSAYLGYLVILYLLR